MLYTIFVIHNFRYTSLKILITHLKLSWMSNKNYIFLAQIFERKTTKPCLKNSVTEVALTDSNFNTFSFGKNNNTCNLQTESYKFASLSFEQGFQIVIPPRSPPIVPEPIGKPSDCILHWSNCCLLK